MNKSKTSKKIQRAFYVMIWRFLPPCKDVVRMMSDSLDADLSLREKITVKLHLLSCKACVRFLVQIKFLSKAMDEFEENPLPATDSTKLSDDVRERLKSLF